MEIGEIERREGADEEWLEMVRGKEGRDEIKGGEAGTHGRNGRGCIAHTECNRKHGEEEGGEMARGEKLTRTRLC